MENAETKIPPSVCFPDAVLTAAIIYLCDRNPQSNLADMEEALLRMVYLAPLFYRSGLTAMEAGQQLVIHPRIIEKIGEGWSSPIPANVRRDNLPGQSVS